MDLSKFQAGAKTAGTFGVVLAALIGVMGTWANETTNDINEMKSSHNQDYRQLIEKITSSNHELRKDLIAAIEKSDDKVIGRIENITANHELRGH